MDIENKPYKGYFPFLRAVILLFKTKKEINFNLLGSYLAFLIEADWDFKHLKYKYIEATDEELAEKWGCSLTTIWRKKKDLEQLGLLSKGRRKMTVVKHFELFERDVVNNLANVPFSNKDSFISVAEKEILKFHGKISKMKEKRVQEGLQSFKFSSKRDLSFPDSDNEIISDEDLDEIARNIDTNDTKNH